MARIRCFLVEPTGESNIVLRRFRYLKEEDESVKCTESGMGYHNAKVTVGTMPTKHTTEGYLDSLDLLPHDDERWPKTCACGYKFTEEDHWQIYQEELYDLAINSKDIGPNSGPWGRRNLPPGALLYPVHSQTWPFYKAGPDGKVLMVITPEGEWVPDGPSKTCQKGEIGWNRTGEVPNITIRPSIGIGQPFRYHAFLTDGWLEDC